MDTLVTVGWETLGMLWRVLLVLIPLAAIIWAVTKGHRADSRKLERSQQDAVSRQTDTLPMNFPPVG